jgi:hypothetical protein
MNYCLHPKLQFILASLIIYFTMHLDLSYVQIRQQNLYIKKKDKTKLGWTGNFFVLNAIYLKQKES